MPPGDEHLFPQHNTARYGDNRRKRPLFLPNQLRDRSTDKRLEGPAQDKAHEIICKWADLESSGKLQKEKETSLEAEFVTQVFGEALVLQRYLSFAGKHKLLLYQQLQQFC